VWVEKRGLAMHGEGSAVISYESSEPISEADVDDEIRDKTETFKRHTFLRRKFVKLMNIYVMNERMWSERDSNDIKNALSDKMYELSVYDRNDLEGAFRILMND
jgi:hypothetical protein